MSKGSETLEKMLKEKHFRLSFSFFEQNSEGRRYCCEPITMEFIIVDNPFMRKFEFPIDKSDIFVEKLDEMYKELKNKIINTIDIKEII